MAWRRIGDKPLFKLTPKTTSHFEAIAWDELRPKTTLHFKATAWDGCLKEVPSISIFRLRCCPCPILLYIFGWLLYIFQLSGLLGQGAHYSVLDGSPRHHWGSAYTIDIYGAYRAVTNNCACGLNDACADTPGDTYNCHCDIRDNKTRHDLGQIILKADLPVVGLYLPDIGSGSTVSYWIGPLRCGEEQFGKSWQLDSLFNSSSRVTSKETSRLHIAGPLWEESHSNAESFSMSGVIVRWQEFLAWWYMMTSPTGNIFRVTGHLCGEFTAQRPVTWNFDVFFDLRLNERLSKHSLGIRVNLKICIKGAEMRFFSVSTNYY